MLVVNWQRGLILTSLIDPWAAKCGIWLLCETSGNRPEFS
jgi:hypothetical protein